MAKRLPNPNRKPGTRGRPQVKIDWDKVNSLLVAGCSGAEICGYLGIGESALFTHCQAEKGMLFSNYARQFYQKGDSILRAKQFEKASKGDNSMLIWLGKNRLKQRDKEPENTNPPNDEQLDALIDWLENQKSSEEKDASE